MYKPVAVNGIEQRLAQPGIVILFIRQVSDALIFSFAHHQHGAGHVPKVCAVRYPVASPCALALVRVTYHEECAARLLAERYERGHAVAHRVSAAHVNLRRDKPLHGVEHAQSGLKVPYKPLHVVRAEFQAAQFPVPVCCKVRSDDVRHIRPGQP